MPDPDVVLCHAARTPVGRFGGTLKSTPASALGAVAIRAVLDRSGVDPSQVDGAVMGHVVTAGAGMNPARQSAMEGGLPESVPAMTVNRVCGSGAQAIATAAQEVRLGQVDCTIAGGMENMDQGPYLLDRARWGHRMGPGTLGDATLRDGLNDAFSGEHSGWHTEDLVQKKQITRKAQVAWAACSQQRFAAAQDKGRFEAEIVSVPVDGKSGETTFYADEANRADAKEDGLVKLRPAFREDGTITAGNASGLNSAAAAMIVASRGFADAHEFEIAARLVPSGVGAVEPGMFGLGPVPAVHQALEPAGWRMDAIERAEINEAFAAIAIALTRELSLSEDIVNVDGGAIALGHPIGATGAILTTRLLHSKARDGLGRGLVTLCIGGGQGIALLLEREG